MYNVKVCLPIREIIKERNRNRIVVVGLFRLNNLRRQK